MKIKKYYFFVAGLIISVITSLYKVSPLWEIPILVIFLKGFFIFSTLSILFVISLIDFKHYCLEIRLFYIGMAFGSVALAFAPELIRLDTHQIGIDELIALFPQLYFASIFALFERAVDLLHDLEN